MTTPDPAAIDLESCRANTDRIYRHSLNLGARWVSLIAAVEALRERNIAITRKNGEYAKWASDTNDRVEAAEAREAALATAIEQTAEHATAEREQLEARVVALEGALDGLLDSVAAHNEANDRIMVDPHATKAATAVLAATPAEALERARVVEEILKAATKVVNTPIAWLNKAAVGKELSDALDKLDALGKEGP